MNSMNTVKSEIRRARVFIGLTLFRVRPRRLRIGAAEEGRPPTVWVDVTRTSRSSRTTGIERVTREISAQLVDLADRSEGVQIRFFRVGLSGLPVEIAPDWYSASREPLNSGSSRACRFAEADVIFLLDLSLPPYGLNRREIGFLRKKKVRISTMVYDTLPLSLPELFPAGKSTVFQEWTRSVEQSNGFVYISKATQMDFRQVIERRPGSSHTAEVVVPLGPIRPSTSEARTQAPREDVNGAPLRIIAVGTIEPRKDYGGILDAVNILWEAGMPLTLTIVGRAGWQSADVIGRIVEHPRYGQELVWHRQASDDELLDQYRASDCLVANSLAEGFGLPLVEALALGVTVLARDIKVFREVCPSATFFEGGSPQVLAKAIMELERSKTHIAKTPHKNKVGGSWRQTGEALFQFFRRLPRET